MLGWVSTHETGGRQTANFLNGFGREIAQVTAYLWSVVYGCVWKKLVAPKRRERVNHYRSNVRINCGIGATCENVKGCQQSFPTSVVLCKEGVAGPGLL